MQSYTCWTELYGGCGQIHEDHNEVLNTCFSDYKSIVFSIEDEQVVSFWVARAMGVPMAFPAIDLRALNKEEEKYLTEIGFLKKNNKK